MVEIQEPKNKKFKGNFENSEIEARYDADSGIYWLTVIGFVTKDMYEEAIAYLFSEEPLTRLFVIDMQRWSDPFLDASFHKKMADNYNIPKSVSVVDTNSRTMFTKIFMKILAHLTDDFNLYNSIEEAEEKIAKK